MTLRKIEVAEMIEDDDYIMDLEALKSEAGVCLQDLNDKMSHIK
jgi:hypothetical protein